MRAILTDTPYTVTDANGLALLEMADGRSQWFETRADAEREGQRLAKRDLEPPLMWLRVVEIAPGTYPIPHGAKPTHCASCGASIVWRRTESGAPIPLSLATACTVGGQRVATSHFADCPDAKEWSEG